MTIELRPWVIFHERFKELLDEILVDQNGVVLTASRVKSLDSIKKKMQRRKLESVDRLTDIVGFKVVVEKDADIISAFTKISSNLVVLEAVIFSKTDLAKKFEMPEIALRAESEGPYNQLTFVAKIGENRRNLPEWKKYASFVVEIKILTSFGNAFQAAAHSRYYETQGEISRDRFTSTLTVTSNLSLALDEFNSILSKSELHEKRDIHPFIEKYPFILHSSPVDFYSEVPIGLGTEYRIDFMIKEGDGGYLLVEIENSKHKLFTKSGDFTSAVNHAQRQIEDWQQWIEENLSTVQRSYPDMLSPRGLVVIGRSSELTKEEKVRLARRNISLRGRIAIWTYDDLIKNAEQFINSIKVNTQV